MVIEFGQFKYHNITTGMMGIPCSGTHPLYAMHVWK